MIEKELGRGGPDVGRNDDDGRTFYRDPNVRALLDHVAEELATEFVRLMRVSVAPEGDAGRDEEER